MADFKKILQEEVKKAVLDIYQVNLEPNIEHPGQSGHGDYSSNVALLLAKDLKLPPVKIAEEVSQMIKKRKLSVLRSLEVVAPGFLNFWLSDDVLIQEVAEILKSKDKYGSSSSGKGRKLVVEYSSPNIAKRFGVGHLRSTVIGQALFNLYSFLGYQTIGDNHLGDWGTQFGILLFQITDKKLPLKKLTIEKLEELYVEFHENSADQPQMMEEARAWFKKLEDRDQEARRIWQAVVKLSVAEFDRIYDILGIKIDHSYGESSYEEEMKEVIKEVRNKGLSRKSQGAEIVEFPNIPPALLLKSDGATTYFTRDLATIRFRLGEWGPQKIIYEVGADQKLHFQQVFAAAKMLGWDKNREFVHVAHGLIRFPEGKMSTRRGKTIKLEDILTEAVKQAKVVVAKSANSKGLSPKQKEEVAQALGIGAVKYFDLSHQPQTDIIFDWEKMFLLEGNSGPYLQYTYARSNSVVVKGKDFKTISHAKLGQEELPLFRYLYRFPEVVTDAAINYSPNFLCNYLFELAQLFNSFYAATPILKAEGELRNLRLALTAATAQTLKNGLTLLGISTPGRL